MEIYSSTEARADLPAEYPVYRSRTRLLVGLVIWIAGVAGFAYMAFDGYQIGQKGVMGMGLFLLLGAVLLLVNCLRGLAAAGTPVIVLGHTGITLPSGQVLAWENMQSNTFVDQTYGFIPMFRGINIETNLPGQKKIAIPATSLAISGKEYLELCDAYSAR